MMMMMRVMTLSHVGDVCVTQATSMHDTAKRVRMRQTLMMMMMMMMMMIMMMMMVVVCVRSDDRIVATLTAQAMVLMQML